MDLMSLGFLVAAMFGLVAGDAMFDVDTVHLDFSVASELTQQGLDKTTVENLFDHHVSTITRHRSVVRPPLLRTPQHKSIVSALAESLQIEPLKAALQDVAGFDPVRLYGSLIVINGNIRLILAGYDNRNRPLLIEVERPPAEPLPLLWDGAAELVRLMDPYHYALALLEEHTDDHAVRRRLAAHLEARRNPATGAGSAGELSLFENLSGILALLQADELAAEQAFFRSATLAPEQSLARLNLAFLRVHQDRHGDAVAEVETAIGRFDRHTPKDMVVAAHLTRGVARWGLGQFGGARADFRHAIATDPANEAAHQYWAMMERAEGNAAAAEKLQRSAHSGRAKFDLLPELAAHYFWLSPDGDDPLRQRRVHR